VRVMENKKRPQSATPKSKSKGNKKREKINIRLTKLEGCVFLEIIYSENSDKRRIEVATKDFEIVTNRERLKNFVWSVVRFCKMRRGVAL